MEESLWIRKKFWKEAGGKTWMRGNRLGIIICTAVFSFFAIFNAVFDRNNDLLFAMYGSFIVAEAYEKYRFTGKKKLLMWSAFGILVMLLFSIHYIGEVVSVL